MSWERLRDYLQFFNPKLEARAANRYANMIMDEAIAQRYPTVRKLMSEALRWKSPAQMVGGYSAGPKKVSDLEPPPTDPGIGARPPE